MIYCNECGNPVSEGLNFCTECGARIFGGDGGAVDPLQPTIRANINPNLVGIPSPPSYPKVDLMARDGAFDPLAGGTQSSPSVFPKGLFIIFGMVVILGVAVIVYLAARAQPNSTEPSASSGSMNSTTTPTGSSSTSSSTTTSSAESLAASLSREIDNGRLVTLTGDDAYTYFTQLRATDPQHPALSNVKSKVLPQLRSTGEEIIGRKVNHSGEVSKQDWMTSVRVYEWAHMLEPADKALEARQKYVQGKLAEANKNASEAWQSFSAAERLDPSWAVPPNDLGYLTTQGGGGTQKWSKAISYYERAISLQSDWDIPHNNMGTAYYYLNNFATAINFYRRAIQLSPNWARPHKWLGDIYDKQQVYADALREYQTAENLYNPNTDSLDINNIRSKIAQLRARGY